METSYLQKISNDWNVVTWEIIEFKDPGLSKINKLLQDTFDVLKKYRNQELVPKEISGILLEMYDFRWWVMDLKESPLHPFYQDISSAVNALNKYFLYDQDDSEVEALIANIHN